MNILNTNLPNQSNFLETLMLICTQKIKILPEGFEKALCKYMTF